MNKKIEKTVPKLIFPVLFFLFSRSLARRSNGADMSNIENAFFEFIECERNILWR